MKKRLKELQKALKEKFEVMKAALVALAKAKKDGDEDKIEAAQKAYDDAKAGREKAHENLAACIEEAEELKKDADLQKKAEGLLETKVPDFDGLGEGDESDSPLPAEPKDQKKHAEAESNAFCKFMQKKRLSDGEMKLLAPTSQSQRLVEAAGDDNAEESVKIPAAIWAKMIGAKTGAPEEKSIPSTSTDNEAAGGGSFLHFPEFSTELQMLPPDNPNVFERVRKKVITGSQFEEPKVNQDGDTVADEFGGVIVSRNTEGASANETELSISQNVYKTYPLDAYTEVTNRLLRLDRMGFEASIVAMFRGALVRTFNNEIIHGTGDAGEQALGIRMSDDTIVVGRQVADQVSYTDLVNLEHAIRVAVRQGASFSLADSVWKFLKLIQQGSDANDKRPLFSATTGSGPHDRLDNFPYFTGIDMSQLGTNGDVIFGNWLQYLWVIEQEAIVSRSQHFKFKNGLTAFRIDAAAGGKPRHGRAFSVLVGTGGS